MLRSRKQRSSSLSLGGVVYGLSNGESHVGLHAGKRFRSASLSDSALGPAAGSESGPAVGAGSIQGAVPSAATNATSLDQAVESSKTIMESLFLLQGGSNMLLHREDSNLALSKLLLDRLRALDEYDYESQCEFERKHGRGHDREREHENTRAESILPLQSQWLLQPDTTSGYTPLHSAIFQGDLPRILLLLRHAMDVQHSGRIAQRPITALQQAQEKYDRVDRASSVNGKLSVNGRSCSVTPKQLVEISRHPQQQLLDKMVIATDWEGLTPFELLIRLQKGELARCRQFMASVNTAESSLLTLQEITRHQNERTRSIRSRQSSFDVQEIGDGGDLDILQDHGRLLFPQENESDEYYDDRKDDPDSNISVGCEVVVYGPGGGGSHCSDSASASSPQRIKEFAQDTVGRAGSAVLVAAAAHHTLVLTREGTVYAFGLGKGGRLGTGGTGHCPLPTRVLLKQKVKHVAAAENHSLAATETGTIYSWGSNRFGQLGSRDASALSNDVETSASCRSTPRRVEDLKQVPCVAVACGSKHSVAMACSGEIYVWGDNSSGQLGISRRSGAQKVQRVSSLWNSNVQRKAIAIAASDYSTVALVARESGASNNAAYTWGHGNTVPSKVHFTHGSHNTDDLSCLSRRIINPVAIASGKYHHAFITSDGCVYTLGFHADTRGRSSSVPSSDVSAEKPYERTLPQLVRGLLSEKAVAVAASQHITAVVTDTGSLYTWGASKDTGVLGPGVGARWQPNPKRVLGIHRAIGVAVAKEHTVVLIGATFPASNIPKTGELPSLELLSSSAIAKKVDLFNAIPILVMAERTESSFLVDYCTDFIKRNLDGILNLGRDVEKLNQFLNDKLADGMHVSRHRDEPCHPLLVDVVMAGSPEHANFHSDRYARTPEWIRECHMLLTLGHFRFPRQPQFCRSRRSSSYHSKTDVPITSGAAKNIKESFQRCINMTSNMDLSTISVAQTKLESLGRERRGLRKRLNQITMLEQSDHALSTEQRDKINRRPLLEKELKLFDHALREVNARIEQLRISAKQAADEQQHCLPKGEDVNPAGMKVLRGENIIDDAVHRPALFECQTCKVSCQDSVSFELHRNGRKHRAKAILALEEEKRQVSATLAKKSYDFQSDAVKPLEPEHRWHKHNKAPWIVSEQPKYVLPPPPHSIVPHVDTAPSGAIKPKTPDLRDIMQQEASKHIAVTSQSKSPTAQILPKSSLPVGSTRCLPRHLLFTPPSNSTLGDFITSPTRVKTPQKASPMAPWASPPESSNVEYSQVKLPSTPTCSLRDIQKEESELRARQDQSFGKEMGSWFIERRDRAGCLLKIQNEEREEQLMIEEQYAIEAQIERENSRRRRKADENRKQGQQNSNSRKFREKKKRSCAAEATSKGGSSDELNRAAPLPHQKNGMKKSKSNTRNRNVDRRHIQPTESNNASKSSDGQASLPNACH